MLKYINIIAPLVFNNTKGDLFFLLPTTVYSMPYRTSFPQQTHLDKGRVQCWENCKKCTH